MKSHLLLLGILVGFALGILASVCRGNECDPCDPGDPPDPPGYLEARTYAPIRTYQQLRDWSLGDNPFAKLSRTITHDGGAKITIPRGHTLLRDNPQAYIDLDSRHNSIQWDGTIDQADVGTAMLFYNSTPNYGLMPKAHPGDLDVYAFGGVPWKDGVWQWQWMASVHGRMGASSRPASWWDDGRPDWQWLQAMIDSSPKVGTRQNDAEFQLGDQSMIIDRPLSLDYRYCQIRGRGRDIPTLNAEWNLEACANYPMTCFFVMQSAVQLPGTGGFDSKVLNLTINGGGAEGVACFWGGTRLEEQCEIAGITVFKCPQFFLWTSGWNGLIVQDCHIAGNSMFAWPTGVMGPEGPETVSRGSTVIYKGSGAVGQGHCRVSDIHLNVAKGWFIDMSGGGNLWVRDCDTEGCERLLYQQPDNSFVSISNINHFWNNPPHKIPFIYIGATVVDGKLVTQASAITSITNVRMMGGYGFDWLHDAQMGEGDSPLLQNLGTSLFHLRHYSRAISLYAPTVSYRIEPDLEEGGGMLFRPGRNLLRNDARQFNYKIQPY